MNVLFELLATGSLPIDLTGIVPAALAGKSRDEIARLAVLSGNRAVTLGEIFNIAIDAAVESDGRHLSAATTVKQDTLTFCGNLTHVHELGAGMTAGRIIVEGNLGLNAGCEMSGGELVIHGNADAGLGLSLRGGIIHVRGNAGDGAGAALPGKARGMSGGVILIDGNASAEVGRRMRRGLIAIGGDCGPLAGNDMLAGTLVIGGDCGAHAGYGMRRGSILVLGKCAQPEVTFRRGYRQQPTFVRLIATELARLGWPHAAALNSAYYQAFHGDGLHHSRGELLLADGK